MTDDYLSPEPTRDETADRMLGLRDVPRGAFETAIKNANIERSRYKAALRKIAEWHGYKPAPIWFTSDKPLTDYERGANDMLETLAGFAKEALS